MSIQLYRIGDSHKIRGILCETQKFNSHSWIHNLLYGWRLSPEDVWEEMYPDKDLPERDRRLKNRRTEEELLESIGLGAKYQKMLEEQAKEQEETSEKE